MTLRVSKMTNGLIIGVIMSSFLFACGLNAKMPAPGTSIEIYDDAALAIIDPQATIFKLGEGYGWSEGPVWIKEGAYLLFSDVPNNRIYKFKEGEGVRLYLEPSGATGIDARDSQQGANGLLVDSKGRLVIMQHGDRRVAYMDAPLANPSTAFISLASHYQGMRFNSPNDGVFHSNGDLYFTDPPYGLAKRRNDPNKQLAFDGLFRVKANGEVILEDDEILFPNGVVLSKDEKTLFVAASDNKAARIYRYEVDSEGDLSNKQVMYDGTALVGQENEQGLPDGMVVHSKEYLFATGPGGVLLFDNQGKLLAKIRTGKITANCTLSEDEKTLYMTAHDTLMSVALR